MRAHDFRAVRYFAILSLAATLTLAGCAPPTTQLTALLTGVTTPSKSLADAADLAAELKQRAKNTHDTYVRIYPNAVETDRLQCRTKYDDFFVYGDNTKVVESRKDALDNLAAIVAGLIKMAGGDKSGDNALADAQNILGAVASDLKYAPLGSNAQIMFKTVQVLQQYAQNERADQLLRDALSKDQAGKSNIWNSLDTSIDNIKNTNSAAGKELENTTDVWEECQRAIYSAAGRLDTFKSSDEVKLASAELEQDFDADMNTLSARLKSAEDVKQLDSQLDKIKQLLLAVQAGLDNPNTTDWTGLLYSTCQVGSIIASATQGSGSTVGAGGGNAGTSPAAVAHAAGHGAAGAVTPKPKGSAQAIACVAPQSGKTQAAAN
jgi:hypothetical protein